jgi:hypothetical protein
MLAKAKEAQDETHRQDQAQRLPDLWSTPVEDWPARLLELLGEY